MVSSSSTLPVKGASPVLAKSPLPPLPFHYNFIAGKETSEGKKKTFLDSPFTSLPKTPPKIAAPLLLPYSLTFSYPLTPDSL